MKNKRLLIVEDEPALSSTLLNMLESFGLEGSIAQSAAQAHQSLNKSKFDYIMIDMTLPDCSGIELYRQVISQHPEYKGRAIFTSGSNVSEELKQIIDTDGLSFLPKPFSINDFKKIISGIK